MNNDTTNSAAMKPGTECDVAKDLLAGLSVLADMVLSGQMKAFPSLGTHMEILINELFLAE